MNPYPGIKRVNPFTIRDSSTNCSKAGFLQHRDTGSSHPWAVRFHDQNAEYEAKLKSSRFLTDV